MQPYVPGIYLRLRLIYDLSKHTVQKLQMASLEGPNYIRPVEIPVDVMNSCVCVDVLLAQDGQYKNLPTQESFSHKHAGKTLYDYYIMSKTPTVVLRLHKCGMGHKEGMKTDVDGPLLSAFMTPLGLAAGL